MVFSFKTSLTYSNYLYSDEITYILPSANSSSRVHLGKSIVGVHIIILLNYLTALGELGSTQSIRVGPVWDIRFRRLYWSCCSSRYL